MNTSTMTYHPSPLSSSRVFIKRSLTHSLRDGEGLLMAIALPALLMLMFTVVFGGAIQSDGKYIDYVVPGIILTCAGFGASSTAVSVNRDMTAGAMLRFRTMPIVASTAVIGHIVASLVRNLVATAVVVGIAFALGFRPTATANGWLLAVGIITLWILAITCIFSVIGLLAGSPESANGYGFIILFLPYLSSAFVPVDTMPNWIAPLATHQPVTPIIETIRAALVEGTGQTLTSITWCVSLILGAAILGIWRFPRTPTR